MLQFPRESVTIVEPSGRLLVWKVGAAGIAALFRPPLAVGRLAVGVARLLPGGLSPTFSCATLQFDELEKDVPPELAVCAAAIDAPQPNAISAGRNTFMASLKSSTRDSTPRPGKPTRDQLVSTPLKAVRHPGRDGRAAWCRHSRAGSARGAAARA